MRNETLLHRYHTQPGKTAAVFERWRNAAGRSSYEVVVEETGAIARDARVVDLACGDGHLLGLLARLGFENLTGVDLSPHELAAARKRLGPRVELYCEDVRSLSLPDESFDLVLCHMALMLIEPVDSAVGEIARILKPGGCFLAVVNRFRRDPASEVFRAELHRITAECEMERLKLGDPRVLTAPGLNELIRKSWRSGDDVHIEDFDIQTKVTRSQLWAMLSQMYDVFPLPASARAELQARLLPAWEPLMDAEGQLTCTMGMRLLKCQVPAFFNRARN